MTSAKSTKRPRPDKPRPDFPLFPHLCGQWAKKIRGRFVYFGPWSDPDGALRLYLRQKDDLLAGRKPRPVDESEGGVTVAHATPTTIETRPNTKSLMSPSPYVQGFQSSFKQFFSERALKNMAPTPHNIKSRCHYFTYLQINYGYLLSIRSAASAQATSPATNAVPAAQNSAFTSAGIWSEASKPKTAALASASPIFLCISFG